MVKRPKRIAKLFVRNLNKNPKVQLRIHTIGFWYWIINFPVVSALFFLFPHVWLKWGLFITLIYSIYANFTSDYTGMSAAQTVQNTENLEVEAENANVKAENADVEAENVTINSDETSEESTEDS